MSDERKRSQRIDAEKETERLAAMYGYRVARHGKRNYTVTEPKQPRVRPYFRAYELWNLGLYGGADNPNRRRWR